MKTNFKGWDDVLPVDYTRTSESVSKRGVDLKAIMQRDQIKTDLSALFMPRQPTMSAEEAVCYLTVLTDSNSNSKRLYLTLVHYRQYNILNIHI